MNSFFLQPDQPATIQLYNGTFEKSENVITRDRMQDVSLVGNGNRRQLSEEHWTEDGLVTVLNFRTGAAGTWVAGVSIRPNNIELSAKDFNAYLEHDGVFDMLEWRKANGALDQPAVEKYAKHVKAVFQVGETTTEDWSTALGYPVEFMPMQNPYDLKVGEMLQVKLLRNGAPLANQLVYAGFSGGGHGHSHDGDSAHRHDEDKRTTDADGLVQLKIDHAGHWYLRTIHMALSEEEGLTHESNWATLTFEVRQAEVAAAEGHPYLWYGAGALVVLAGLFFYFRKK